LDDECVRSEILVGLNWDAFNRRVARLVALAENDLGIGWKPH